MSNTIKVNDTIKAFYKKSFKLIIDTLITGIEYNKVNKKYMILTNKNKMYEFDIVINTSSLTIRNRFKQVYNYDPPLYKFVMEHKINCDFIKDFEDNHDVYPKSVAYIQLMGLDQFFDNLQYECLEVKDKKLYLVKEEELNDKDAINNPIVYFIPNKKLRNFTLYLNSAFTETYRNVFSKDGADWKFVKSQISDDNYIKLESQIKKTVLKHFYQLLLDIGIQKYIGFELNYDNFVLWCVKFYGYHRWGGCVIDIKQEIPNNKW